MSNRESQSSNGGELSTLAGVPQLTGKRLFVGGCIVLFLFSSVHLIPMFMDFFGTPTDPLQIEAKRAMSAVVVEMGPFHTHWGKLNQLLSASYSALLYFVVALNLVVLPAIGTHERLRAIAFVNAAFSGALLLIAIIFQFPPPGVFSLVAGLLFMASALRASAAVNRA